MKLEKDFLITLEHVRAVIALSPAGTYCVPGMRGWAKLRGLDWRGFVRNGISAQTLLDTDDFLARRVVEYAIAMEEAKNGQP